MNKIIKNRHLKSNSLNNARVASLSAIMLISGSLLLQGCSRTNNEKREPVVIEANEVNPSDLTVNICYGTIDEVRVSGESFKLRICYSCNNKEWNITDNKIVTMDIYTVGLPDEYGVFIGNVHSDTTILSTKERTNGILQDSMDDHTNNIQLLGFPIDDDTSYVGINSIEGQNNQFIQSYAYASEVNKQCKRNPEQVYLDEGVWGNKINTTIDLLIVEKDTYLPIRKVSVNSTIVIKAEKSNVNNIVGAKTLVLAQNKKRGY